MKFLHSPFFSEKDRVCPWWLIWTFDNPLRRIVQDPGAIVGPLVREGMIVADIGCGGGYFSIPLAKMVGGKGAVIAVDLQEKILGILTRRARTAGVADRIRCQHAHEDDIMVREPVDFVLAFWMVHEVKDVPRFFNQVCGVLKQGGTILYVEPRLHVSRVRFGEILECARHAGFQVRDSQPVWFSSSALLVKEH
jgi:ubiquinone/menaquinone biosynthesis C-methylase UbiE